MVTASGVRGDPRGPQSRRRSWDTVEAPRRFQAWLVVPALLVLPFGVLAALLRVFPPRADTPALLAAFISYGLLADAVALGLLLVALIRARRRAALSALAGVSAVLLGLQLSWVAPLFVADDRPAATEPFVVMSLNVLFGEADPDQVFAAAASADLVVLAEATPAAARRLEEGGWRERFPYAAGDPLRTGNGTALYSRFPLRDAAQLPRTSFPQWSATAEVPGVGPVRVIAAHPCNPFCGRDRWDTEHEVLREAVAAAPPDLPLVVAGDLNAVNDHRPLLALGRAGLTSATDLAGAGWLPTFPATAPLPPLLPIDHVLVDDRLTALAIERFEVSGSDHLGLRATLAGTR